MTRGEVPCRGSRPASIALVWTRSLAVLSGCVVMALKVGVPKPQALPRAVPP